MHRLIAGNSVDFAVSVCLMPPLRLIKPKLVDISIALRIELFDENAGQCSFLLRRQSSGAFFDFIKKRAHPVIIEML